MDDFMKTEAKDIISTAVEKASGATGINIKVSERCTSLFIRFLNLNEPVSHHYIQFACKFVKDSMDRQFGPCWHCVMGEGFSFEVTRQAKTTLYMYYAGKIAILLFKC